MNASFIRRKIWVYLPFVFLLNKVIAQTNVLPTTGNVGIGITSPSVPLHIQGASGTPLLRIGDGTYHSDFKQDGYHTVLEGSSRVYINWGSAPNRSSIIMEAASNQRKFYLSGTYGATMNGWGGLSVGHNEKFGFYTIGATGKYEAIGSFRVDNNFWGLTFSTRNQGNNIEAARFSTPGNLLIGTTADNGKKLQVNGDIFLSPANPFIYFRDQNNYIHQGDNSFLLFSSNAEIAIKQEAALPITNLLVNPQSSFRISKNGSEDIFKVNYAGNVGIGTTNPTEKLSVNGTILSKKVKVTQTGWPDFVFLPTYDLPTIPFLKSYIATHKHLPNIPSEKEIIENGHDLGEMNKKLLQKVEELTLYIIDLNDKFDAVKRSQELQEEELKYLKRIVKELSDRKAK